MNKKARKSDSIKNGSSRSKIRNVPSKKKKIVKKQIRQGSSKSMFVGMDLHKKFLQVAIMDDKGNVSCNDKVENTHKSIKKYFAKKKILLSANIVMESSSVWYDTYRFLTDDLGYKNVALSNPYLTKAIASSKKKTDKVDAKILADLLRGGYIATCYVPDKKIVEQRKLVRYRKKLIQWRTSAKNSIHGVLLQEGIRIPGVTFTETYCRELKALGDYRIDGFLRHIDYLTLQIAEANYKVCAAVKSNPDAMLIKTIPGIGDYSALVIASEIAGIERFNDSHKLCSYAGVVPSVRNSANTVHHGSITKRGSITLRWVLTECIHAHVIHAQSSDITIFYNRVKEKRGSSKATVAGASKLLRVIYWMLKERREFVQNYS